MTQRSTERQGSRRPNGLWEGIGPRCTPVRIGEENPGIFGVLRTIKEGLVGTAVVGIRDWVGRLTEPTLGARTWVPRLDGSGSSREMRAQPRFERPSPLTPCHPPLFVEAVRAASNHDDASLNSAAATPK
jgi:hypothetical protein